MTMKTGLCLLFTLIFFFSSALGQNNKTSIEENLDLIFLVDGSYSVGRINFGIVLEWIITFVNSFNLSSGLNRIGLIQYSHYFDTDQLDQQDYIETEIELGMYQNRSLFNIAVREIQWQGFTTYTAHAMLKAIQDFQTSDRFNNSSTEKVLIILTHGRSTDSETLEHAATQIQEAGISSFAIGIGDAEMSEILTMANNNVDRVFYVNHFNDLSTITEDLMRLVKA